MNSVTRKLIAKEFYLNRWMLVGATLVGFIGLAIAADGPELRFDIGFLIWLTTIIAFGVILAMFGIASERKERALLFVLSLPLSHGGYIRIKLHGLLLCFLVPWTLLSVGGVALVYIRPNLPDGMLPFTVLLCGFMLANFSLVLCAALHFTSEGAMSAVIVTTNMFVTLFLFLVGSIPSIGMYTHGPIAVWNSAFWAVLAAEAALLAITLTLPHFVAARRRDFI
jgi:ABC-2 type transport system permease protein